MGLQVGGLATGIDTASLIQQMMAAERQPITTLETRRVKVQAVSTAFQDLSGKLAALQARADTLRDPEAFYSRAVNSSDESVAVASGAPGSTRGTFTVTVSALARGSFAAGSVTKSSLSDTIATADGEFSFRLGASGSIVKVAVSPTTTLAQLVTAINATHAGVRATAVNTGTTEAPAYTLTLASTGTGLANDITVVTDGTSLGVTTTQHALDAAFTVGGLGSFTRSTNTFADVIEGVTVTLKAPSGSADLTVDYDKASTQKRVQSLVDAYNDVVRAIDGQSGTRNADGTITPGAFSGDGLPRTIRRRLASLIATNLGGSVATLASLGITTQKDGTLTLDAAKFQARIAEDPAAVQRVVAGAEGQDGVADLLFSATDSYTRAVGGTIAVRRDSLTATMRQMQTQIDDAQRRLDATEQTLRARFANLEHVVSQMQSSGASLLTALSQLNAPSR